MMRRDVFQAIADPTRREIINVMSRGAYTLNSVAENFDISRPAISRHIKILAECGLVVIKQKGRERYCEAQLQKLNEVSLWVGQYRIFWTKRLDALGDFLTKEMEAERKAMQKKKMPVISAGKKKTEKAAIKSNAKKPATKTKQ